MDVERLDIDDFLNYLDFGSSTLSNIEDSPPSSSGHTSGSSDYGNNGYNALQQQQGSLAYSISNGSSGGSPQDRLFQDCGEPSSATSFYAHPLPGKGNVHPIEPLNARTGQGYSSTSQWQGGISSNSSNGTSSMGNSPPFDTSLYQNVGQGVPLVQQQSQQLPSFLQYKSVSEDNFAGMLDSSIPSPTNLSHQWQSLMLQQAQLQLQMQQHALQAQMQGQRPPSLAEPSPSLSGSSNVGSPLHSDISGSDRRASASLASPPQHVTFADTFFQDSNSNATTSTYQTQALPTSYAPRQPASSQQGQQIQKQSAPTMSQPAQAPASITIVPPTLHQTVPSLHTHRQLPKASLKRSYQQVKQEDSEATTSSQLQSQDTAHLLAPASSTNAAGSNGNSADESANGKGGHNAVEQKYRRGINDSLILLREIVPALGHLRAAPGTAPTKRKMSQFSLAAAATPAAPSAFVDGVAPPKKLSKQLILATSADYIRFLQNRREELEGELHALQEALVDCLEDSKVVLDLAEQRWAPERAKILAEREAMSAERAAPKEGGSSRKKAKTDGGAVKKGKGGKEELDSDDEDEDSDEEMADSTVGVTSALPARGQVKARGKTQGGAKKAGAQGQAPFRGPPPAANGPPKALMGVFAGVSFAGGAGYDLLYGAASAAQAEQATTPKAWSAGLVRRSGMPLANASMSETSTLHPMQTFFLERPALLSGLVMLSLSLILGYVLLYLLPSAYARLSQNTTQRRKEEARALLVRRSKDKDAVSSRQERKALATLAGSAGWLGLPTSLTAAAFKVAIGYEVPKKGSSDPAAIETAATSLRLLESDASNTGSSYLTTFSSYLHLYSLLHSSSWPANSSLTSHAQAVLALHSVRLLGSSGISLGQKLWSAAQAGLKKQDLAGKQSYVAMALRMPYNEALMLERKSSASLSLLQVAESQCEGKLVQHWRDVFTQVMAATTQATSSDLASSSTPTQASQLLSSATIPSEIVDEILASLPPTSHLYALALLSRGVEAVGRNVTNLAVRVATALASSSHPELSSVKAFSALVSGVILPSRIESPSTDCDTLAYAVVSWLHVRQLSLSQKADEDLQMHTLELRRLFAADIFQNSEEERFIAAQESVVDALVNIGRKAAGLDQLSDSGCEL